MIRRLLSVVAPPVSPFWIYQSEFHSIVAGKAGSTFIDASRHHDEREINLKHEQGNGAHFWGKVDGVFEYENSGSQPVSHEAWCAHPAQHTFPTHVDKEVAAQKQVNQRGNNCPTSE